MWAERNNAKKTGTALLILAAMAMPAACGQALPAVRGASEAVIRELDDPHTGIHWLVVRDASHPAGPGRLVRAAEFRELRGDAKAAGPNPAAGAAILSLRPVVRAGDRVIVEEHTKVVDARLDGTALEPATAGAAFMVRLKIGGRVIRAMAEGHGRATLQSSLEAGR